MSILTQINLQETMDKFINPQYHKLSQTSIQNIQLLLQEATQLMTEKEFLAHQQQWTIFAKKLNTESKLTYLKQQNYRHLIIELVRDEAIQLLNLSYLNRAKIDQEFIRYLKDLRSYFFIEVIRIVSKLKTIHKHFYTQLSKRPTENHVEIKILKILQLCNSKKRTINSNKAKFLCIVEDEKDRVEITKEMGKMLREAWKQEKNKQFLRFQKDEEEVMEQKYSFNMNSPLKQLAKPALIWEKDCDQSESQFLQSKKLISYGRRYSEQYEVFGH